MGDALALLHAMVLDDGHRWGEVAVDWQLNDAQAVLEPGPDDPHLHWLGRPKGGSKTTDLAAMSLAWLVEQAPAMTDGYAVAADKDQANRLLQRARAIIAKSSGLSDVLEVQTHRILHRRSRATVNALEADVASSEGLLSPWFVVDELPNWADTDGARNMWTSVVSGVPKWPGCRLVVIGHAGDPAHWSRKVLDVAMAEGWRVREVPGPLPWMSEADLEMQRALLLPSDFARRHLNQWTTGHDRLTTAEDLAAAVQLEGPLRPQAGVDYVVAVDLGIKNDRSVAVVAHAEPVDRPGVRFVSEGLDEDAAWAVSGGYDPLEDPYHRPQLPATEHGAKVVLDRIQVWEGSRAHPVQIAHVEEWIAQASSAFNRAPLVFDPWQGIGMQQRLQLRGVECKEFTFNQASVGRLASTMYQLLRNRLLALPDDEELLDELANVRLKETTPGVVRMDHAAGRHDDRALALAMAAAHLLEKPPALPVTAARATDRRLSSGRRAR